jgi:hypothetical protein
VANAENVPGAVPSQGPAGGWGPSADKRRSLVQIPGAKAAIVSGNAPVNDPEVAPGRATTG